MLELSNVAEMKKLIFLNLYIHSSTLEYAQMHIFTYQQLDFHEEHEEVKKTCAARLTRRGNSFIISKIHIYA